MNKLNLIVPFYISIMYSQNNTMIEGASNYKTFGVTNQTNITAQLNNLTPTFYKNNPEYGILPIDASCSECVELIHKRTEYTREYLKGSQIYNQTGYSKINYLDSNGYYREINHYISATGQSNIYAALNQPVPTYIDIANKKLSIKFDHNIFEFSRNLKLIFQDSLGVKSTLANANWNQITVGKDGVFITNIFPNIDFEGRVMPGSFKTSFILKSQQAIPSKGWLIISDDLNSNFTPLYNYSNSLDEDGKVNGNLYINAPNNKNFAILQGIVASSKRGNYQSLYYRMISNTLELMSNSTWLNDSATKYPVSIDPVVTNAATLAQAAITGSGLNNSGSFVGFCSYNLTVARPANCTLTDVQWTFTYIAQNGAGKNEGAVDFLHGACRSPAAAGFFWFCNSVFGGQCIGTNISIGADLLPCVSPIAACNGNLTFTMRFYDAFAGASCSNNFIGANSPWTMTLIGRNLETLGNTSTGNGSTTQAATCYANSVLNPSVANGVPAYTYLWSSGQTSPTINFMPTAPGNNIISCTVTDACGVVRVATFTVTNNCVLPIELTEFNSTYNGNYAVINWSTATEKNAEYFIIEKSENGVDFTLLEKIIAHGTNYSKNNYSVNDYTPNKKGTNYYRLKQFDFGGIEKYNKLITLDINEELLDIKLMPNPTNSLVDVELSNNFIGKTINIELIDALGKKTILKQNYQINTLTKNIQLDLTEFPKGIFFLNIISDNNKTYKTKIVKL